MSLTRTTNVLVSNPFASDKDPGSPVKIETTYGGLGSNEAYLAKELGLELQAQRNHAQVKALTDPVVWLADYESRITKLLSELAVTLRDKTATYAQVYSTDIAVAKAQRDVSLLFDIAKQELDLIFPGAELLYKQAEATSNTITGRGARLLGSMEKDIESHKQIYKRMRAQKKAKKAKKSPKA